MSSCSSSSSGASIATTVPVEDVFPAGATALPGPGLYPNLADPALQELPDQVIKCVMLNCMPPQRP